MMSAARMAVLVGDEPLRTPAYRDLADRVRVLVVDGRLPDGTRLPSERELAAALGVSRTTTTRVYAELREAGLITSRQGSGSVVQVPFKASTVSSLILDPDSPDDIAMTYSAPSAPIGLASIFTAAAERLPSLLSTTGYLPDGLRELREAIADEMMKFDRLGIFPYSHEENTHAYKLNDDVPARTKKKRAENVMKVQQEISFNLNQQKIGKTFNVLFDRIEGDYFVGRTEYDSPEVDNEVLVKATDYVRIGDFARVTIESAGDYDLVGTVNNS